jgi:hypothetical protein
MDQVFMGGPNKSGHDVSVLSIATFPIQGTRSTGRDKRLPSK